ncbi:MAG: UDP-N-acetylmuramate dehydrogenase [Synergistaceae bacterium]|jgi:UDP-N-acetylmuramate dehydrogenase|nr:UDP-N-acetylmuramate dehydrogenase [Synergistaceae bacterium]
MKRPSAPDLPGTCVRYNAPLSAYTTWGVGGIAETLFTPRCETDLAAALRWIHGSGGVFYVLGGGSNVLISDDALGTPVVLMTGISGASAEERGDCVMLECMAGTPLREALSLSVKNGWSGLEMAAGIPGTVGGAVAGNAGGACGAVGQSVYRVNVLEPDGSKTEVSGEDMDWGYRKCGFLLGGRRVVLSAVFRLKRSTAEEVSEAVRKVMEGRRSQPVSSRTAGCVFKNPSGGSAGRMLEASGCKGMSVGGARVSELHANFIENAGGCSAVDILSLALSCRKKVEDMFGARLAFEVKIFGLPC